MYVHLLFRLILNIERQISTHRIRLSLEIIRHPTTWSEMKVPLILSILLSIASVLVAAAANLEDAEVCALLSLHLAHLRAAYIKRQRLPEP